MGDVTGGADAVIGDVAACRHVNFLRCDLATTRWINNKLFKSYFIFYWSFLLGCWIDGTNLSIERFQLAKAQTLPVNVSVRDTKGVESDTLIESKQNNL